jgi:queuine tRNA-ribosyltransferase
MVDAGAQGFGFGGWPIDGDGVLELDMFKLLATLTPADVPLFALGVGKPEHLVALCQVDNRWVFDCTIPTRDGRHGRLYAFADPAVQLSAHNRFYRMLYIHDDENSRADEPIDAGCDCLTCVRYGRSYLHHLFRVKDTLAYRLASLHNLRFYTRLLDRIAGRGREDSTCPTG